MEEVKEAVMLAINFHDLVMWCQTLDPPLVEKFEENNGGEFRWWKLTIRRLKIRLAREGKVLERKVTWFIEDDYLATYQM